MNCVVSRKRRIDVDSNRIMLLKTEPMVMGDKTGDTDGLTGSISSSDGVSARATPGHWGETAHSCGPEKRKVVDAMGRYGKTVADEGT